MIRDPRDRPGLPEAAEETLATSREKIVSASLKWLALLGGIAYVPSVWLAAQASFWSVVEVDSAAYAVVLALALAGDRLRYRVRAGALLAVFLGLGVFLIVVFGPFGAGPVWLFSFSVLAAVLLGFRGAVIGLAITVVTLATLGLSLGPGTLVPLERTIAIGHVWLVIAVNLLFLAAVVSLAIAAILRGLREAMEARRLAEARLRQAEKLEALGTLAGGIAHDLNNVLQPILSYASIIQKDLGEAHPAQADLKMVVRAGERARELVRRVLVFGRKGERLREPMRVSAVLTESVALLRPSLPAGVDVVREVSCRADTIVADPVEVQQIIMDLGTNGAHAMRERGGRLTLRLDAPSKEELPPSAANATALGLRLTVADSGVGMTEEVLARAFEPFFTTKAPGEGTGLGLSSVHGIVGSLGGAIRLQSTVGVGTTIEVFFVLAGAELPDDAAPEVLLREVPPPPPVEPGAPKPVAAPVSTGAGARAPRSADAAGRRVLLVDDEPAVRSATGRLLTRMGYSVVACESGAEALAALRDGSGAFDVLMTDLSMPHMSGVELAREARLTRQDLPVLLATGFLDDDSLRDGEGLGRLTVLSKPFEMVELAEALRDLLAPP